MTDKYDLEETSYGNPNWNAISTANMEKLDDAIHTILRYKARVGESFTPGDPMNIKNGEWTMPISGESARAFMPSGEVHVSGEYLFGQRIGPIKHTPWSWSGSGEVYIGPDGVPTEEQPAVDPWKYKVGVSIDSVTIILQL